MKFVSLLSLGLSALSIPTVTSVAASGPVIHRPLANVIRCTTPLRQATVCRKFGVRRARRPEVSHWIRAEHRLINGVPVTVTWQYPILKHSHPTVAPVKSSVSTGSVHVPPAGEYTVPMLVTYYEATGHAMANGIMPSVGWAACGYDLVLGTKVDVPGIGVLTCGDREGYDPFKHIDVFGTPLGTGYRPVTVLG